MADEQAQAETTAVEETQEQTTTPEETDSEVVENTSDQGDSKGDLRVPLREERRRRQELESRLNDPEFIYEQARRLGLTEEQTEQAVEQAQSHPQMGQLGAEQVIPKLVKQQLEIEKAKEKYPQLSTDDLLGRMVTSLIDGGMSPLKAADEVMGRFAKAQEAARSEGAKAKETEITEKERASTVPGSPASADSELDALRAQARSLDKRTQEAAVLELIKRSQFSKK